MARIVQPSERVRLNAVATLRVGEGAARYEGPLLGVGRHRGSVPYVVLAQGRPVTVETAEGRLSGRALAIAAGTRHEVLAEPGACALLWYLEPGVWAPRSLATVSRVDAATEAALREPTHWPTRARAVDSRVAHALRAVQADPEATLTSLAEEVQRSPSRLRHLFLEQVGVPMQRYRWWVRLRHVLAALQQRASLTEAAHAAGFADSAHLSRTFRRMFGFAPSVLLEHLQP
jgi:AraC-like DNA-binding protein